jgi:hypothetical protein
MSNTITSAQRIAGWTLVVAPLVSIAVLGHHPFVSSGGSDILPAIAALAARDRVVHGVLIGLFLAMTCAFAVFSMRLGFGRPWVVTGFTLFAAGTAITIAAGIVDGFVVPDVANHYAPLSGPAVESGLQLLRLCAYLVQDCTRVGFAATSAGVLFWSVELLHLPERPTKLSGAFGLLTALAGWVALALVGSFSHANIVPVFACESIWFASAGVLMIRGLV